MTTVRQDLEAALEICEPLLRKDGERTLKVRQAGLPGPPVEGDLPAALEAANQARAAIDRARAEPLPLGHWYVEGKATPGGNWSVLEGDPTKPGIKFQVAVVLTREFAEYMVNTHNRGLERDDICTAACDQPSEQHCLDCGCYQAGYQAGTEAQRERVGGGTA